MVSKNVALITGASSGIGRELARIHARQGGDVIVVARRRDRLEALCASLTADFGVEARFIEQDLAQPGAAQRIFSQVEGWKLEVHTLINNAGFGGMGRFHERDEGEDEAMIAVNISALTMLTHAFLPGMVERASGRILNVASMAGLLPGGPNQAVYFATKAYVISLSRALAQELKDSGVTVTALCPGATDTEFSAVARAESTRLFETSFDVHKVAEDGYRAMLQGKAIQLSALTLQQKILFKLLPFLPKSILLEETESIQAPVAGAAKGVSPPA